MIVATVRQVKGFGSYLAGYAPSIFGNGLWRAVIFWFVWRHTESVLALGWVSATTAVPLLLCAVGGMVADRYNRRRILIASQVVGVAVAAAFAVITLTGYFNLWLVLALNAINGLVTALEFPARNAFKVDMAGTALATRVSSLYVAVDTVAYVSGLMLAGGLIAFTPSHAESVCAVINLVSFFGALWALVMIRPQEPHLTDSQAAPSLRDCLSFAMRDFRVLALLLQLAIVALCFSQFEPLLPAYATEAFSQGSLSGLLLVILQAMYIIGSLISARIENQVGWSWRAAFLLPFPLFVFAVAPNLVISLFALSMIGLLTSLQDTSNFSSTLTIVPQNMVGRFSGWRGSLYWAVSLIAAPTTAYTAKAAGSRLTFMFCAIACLVCLVVAWVYHLLRTSAAKNT